VNVYWDKFPPFSGTRVQILFPAIYKLHELLLQYLYFESCHDQNKKNCNLYMSQFLSSTDLNTFYGAYSTVQMFVINCNWRNRHIQWNPFAM